ncbi:MAG: hypothetical protein ACFCVF_13675 [Kineosporiaceae bacterium]
MAILLHVQGIGRDPLRPFGGHAVRTVAWDRFAPSTVGSDVDTVVASPPDPASAVDLVRALRAAGDDRAVLLVPEETPGWREMADVRLPGATVVLGGMAGLPDYLTDPAAGPGASGGDGGPRNVIHLPRVPRGSGRHDIYRRLDGHGPTVASAVRSWALDLTGDGTTTPAWPLPSPPLIGASPSGPPAPPAAAGSPATPTVPPAPRVPEPVPVREPAEIRLPETAVLAPHSPPAPSVPPGSRRFPDPVRPDPETVALPPSAPADGPGADAPSRRLARAMADPAVLVPAALAQINRIVDAARTPRALAEFLLTHVGADAVEILVPDDSGWRTEVTVGQCPGAGTVTTVVDVPGLVAWLESSFVGPVVLDGSDLGAEGSWVLAAPSRDGEGTVALLLAWRRPGGTIFDPAAVSVVTEAVADASPSLALAAAVHRLARALSVVTD